MNRPLVERGTRESFSPNREPVHRLGNSLQWKRILGGRNLVRVRIVVAVIFDFITVEDREE